MRRYFTFLLLVLSVVLASGCSLSDNFSRPGSMEYQRQQATIHDPYPDTDAAPEIVGGRPLAYQNQRPEPVRSRRFTDIWRGW